MGDYDVPIVRRTVSIRSPRAVVLLNPMAFVVVAIFLVSVVFTLWPETLNHSPISFETRGPIHHIWHYALMVGSGAAIVGMFGTFRRRLEVELAGTVILVGALTMNLIAQIGEAIHPVGDPPSGLAMAVRVGVIVSFLVRIFILVARPQVDAPVLEER